MDDTWFTSSVPVRGKCIHSWTCDQEGRFLSLGYHPETLGRWGIEGEIRPPFTPNNQTALRNDSSASQVSEIVDAQRQSISGLSDSNMAMKLELLIRDAKEAFQTVLSRNSDLERELEGVRESTLHIYQRTPQSQRIAPLSSGSMSKIPPQLHIPISRTLKEQNVFDISTPQTNSHSQRSSSRMSDAISLNGLNQKPVPLDRRRPGALFGVESSRRDSSY